MTVDTKISSSPLLPFDILERIINELGHEANQKRDYEYYCVGPARRALFEFSLVSSATLHPCRLSIFSTLSLRQTFKRDSDPDRYLEETLRMLESNPHLIPYIQQLAFPFRAVKGLAHKPGEIYNNVFPKLLTALKNLRGLVFDGLIQGGYGMETWRGVNGEVQDAMTKLIAHSNLEKLDFRWVKTLPTEMFLQLSPTIRELRLFNIEQSSEANPTNDPTSLPRLTASPGGLRVFTMLSLGFTPPISVLQRLDFSHLTRVDTTVSVQRAEDWTSLGLLLSSARRSLESIKIYYLYRYPPPAPAIVHSFLPNLKELELIITVAIPQYNPNHPYHPMRDLAPTPQTVSYLTTHLPNAGHPSLETIKIQLEWMADIVEGVTPPLGQARLLLDPGLQPEWPPLDAALSNPDSYPRLRSLEFIPLVTVYPARTERDPDLYALPTQQEFKAEELRKQSWYQYAQQEVREIFTRTGRRLVESGGSFVTHTPEFDAYFRT